MTAAFTLYHREGCHLCEDMLRDLQALSSSLSVQKIDIDQDEELHARFNEDVPVLALGDEIICKHFLDESRICEALKYA